MRRGIAAIGLIPWRARFALRPEPRAQHSRYRTFHPIFTFWDLLHPRKVQGPSSKSGRCNKTAHKIRGMGITYSLSGATCRFLVVHLHWHRVSIEKV